MISPADMAAAVGVDPVEGVRKDLGLSYTARHGLMAMRAELAAKVAPRYSAGPYFTNRAMRRAGTPSLVGFKGG